MGELQNQKTPLFWSRLRQVLHNFGSQIPLGGLVLIFGAKIGLKSTKNVLLCIWGLEPPSPTLLFEVLIFFYCSNSRYAALKYGPLSRNPILPRHYRRPITRSMFAYVERPGLAGKEWGKNTLQQIKSKGILRIKAFDIQDMSFELLK